MERKYLKNGLVNYDNFAIGYMEYGCDVEEHLHDSIEIVYTVCGHGEHIINGNVITAKPGTLIIMDYNCAHKIQMWETMRYYNVMIKAPFLNYMLKNNDGLSDLLSKYYKFDISKEFMCVNFRDEDTARRVENLFFEMLREGIHKNPRYIDITRCMIDEVINIVLRNYEIEGVSSKDCVFEDAMRYIRNNSSRPLQLSEVAAKFNYRPEYFSKKLKEYCGMSFKRVLITKRLADVVTELLLTEHPIDDIIIKYGFTNKTFFYELFKKNYGVKPKFIREYRNNYKRYIELKINYKLS